jgi:hypothetical protein
MAHIAINMHLQDRKWKVKINKHESFQAVHVTIGNSGKDGDLTIFVDSVADFRDKLIAAVEQGDERDNAD